MRPQSASLFDFDFYELLPIQVEVSDAPLTSDAGLLPLRQFDDRIGLTATFAAALHDPRDPDRIDHTFPEMVRSRVFGILAGYEDQNDHVTLRTDPVFKLIAARSPTDTELASQPTLSRFENQIDIPSLFRLRDVFIDQFIASFAQQPITLTFDLDAVDDPTHGSQQLAEPAVLRAGCSARLSASGGRALLDRMNPGQLEKRDGGKGRCVPSGRRSVSVARKTLTTTRNYCRAPTPE